MTKVQHSRLQTFSFLGNTVVGEVLSKRLLDAGFEIAPSAENADAILIYCDSQSDLENVFLDSEGLVQKTVPGTFLVNLSVSTPGFARELDAVSLVSDLVLIEAPLFVIDPMAEKAFSDKENLSCFVAGDEEKIAIAKPLLDTLCADVRVTGEPGTAQLSHAALIVLRSAQIISGLETEALFASFSQSSDPGILAAYELGIIKKPGIRLHNAIKNENFSSEYTIAMWMSDLTAALMAADDRELILPGAEACLHLLELLVVVGGGSMSSAALALVYGEEEQCAKHGLDWTRAEEVYSDDEGDQSEGLETNRNPEDFPGGFGSYSAN